MFLPQLHVCVMGPKKHRLYKVYLLMFPCMKNQMHDLNYQQMHHLFECMTHLDANILWPHSYMREGNP